MPHDHAHRSVTNHYGFFRASGALRCNEPDLRGYYPPQVGTAVHCRKCVTCCVTFV
jgi:hypothetical protein